MTCNIHLSDPAVEYSKERRPAVPLPSPQSSGSVEIVASFPDHQPLTFVFLLNKTEASEESSRVRRWHWGI